MHLGRVEEASAIATRIGSAIVKYNTAEFVSVDERHAGKDMWLKVKQLAERTRTTPTSPSGISAHLLNCHYASIS